MSSRRSATQNDIRYTDREGLDRVTSRPVHRGGGRRRDHRADPVAVVDRLVRGGGGDRTSGRRLLHPGPLAAAAHPPHPPPRDSLTRSPSGCGRRGQAGTTTFWV